MWRACRNNGLPYDRMEIEGQKHLRSSGGNGVLVICEQTPTRALVGALEEATGLNAVILSELFRFSPLTWKSAYRKFREVMKEHPSDSGILLMHDWHKDMPLNILANLFLRRWIGYIQKRQWTLIPGLISMHEDKARLRLAKGISPEEMVRFEGRDQIRRFLLTKTRMMDSALELRQIYFSQQDQDLGTEAILPEQDPDQIRQEILNLPSDQCLTRQAEFEVWLARAEQIPAGLQEIGRLREMTFRSVGEGTGKAIDLDEYDLYYEQMIIWDREARRIVGGYRIGRGDHIFREYGTQGFYVSSLFKIRKGFYPIFPQALELGRSYIIEDYQRKRLPLFLLWKGILYFLLANPGYRYLYGPVSISKYYSEISKSLIIYFVRRHFFDHRLARYLSPRKKFAFRVDEQALALLTDTFRGDLDQFNALIEDIEPEHFKLPVLLRQYIRQNARFIAFNLDPNFSDALDGFILLDLRDVPAETLEALQKERFQSTNGTENSTT